MAAPQAPGSFWWWFGFGLTAVSTAVAFVRWYLSGKAKKEAERAREEAGRAKDEAREAKDEVRRSREH